ncbi:MAG: hypothetical protein JRI23_08365 [Deltaproteobacteria bacterium]|nr:hypothetical protein [Deltaproteobacteria bacterium]MBW2531627.1 hypothetical protein [Deltaproteobacteria bacterium]
MSEGDPVTALAAASHGFGRSAAQRKLRLLRQIAEARQLDAEQLRVLGDALSFMRAYPDDRAVRAAVDDAAASMRARVAELERQQDLEAVADSGLPGATHVYSFHYGVVAELVEEFPGCLAIDWESLEDESSLVDALRLSLPAAEVDGLEDERLSLEQWFEVIGAGTGKTDLEILIERLRRSGHAEPVQVKLFDAGDVPVRYHLTRVGTGRCEIELDTARIHYQRQAIRRERFPIAGEILRPLDPPKPCTVADGRRLIRLALAALCSRNLAIYPLIYANPADVTRVRCGRGIEVLLVGIRPGFRAPLETITFYLIAKNGVPVAYGPAGVFLGACEMGINLFPEFRGAEIWYVYSQLMRVLRHVLGVEYFYLLRYGMGEGNPDAIRSGAFWFYRKLGFRPDNPRVEALARQEEARIAAEPGYRSSPAMLRRLSHTEVSFDLSGGRARPFDFGALGVAQSRFVGERFGGDRERAERACSRRVAKLLGATARARWRAPEQASFCSMAPLLAMIDDLPAWSRRDRTALLRAVRARGKVPQATAARAFAAHPRFGLALRQLCADVAAQLP